ncbi:SGNH/GDSL hydrolase family protein [Phycicoccus sp. CSK15P-2]|uniref:SGNH/GDSL hydrolase family protein n=1 Tax=Phycicoccus sp. CSK15P-2 TaxID=2807627 RepID=UPI0019525D81|nr:SGNH/GDSL hydrolase family protein [Phycicoccus sp. CSK15P-2]MBM6403225.1 SGNH/GDSL hydrolase family protein [Phycicoccus sp. CSK15P-2]
MTPRREEHRVWTRYVAIGDSFTEGLSDHDPERDDHYVGWADRLAGHLDRLAEAQHLPFGYANLAVRGRTLSDVVGPQLDAAMRMTPDLVSMVGGGNDLLRPSVDLDGLASRLEEAVVRIRSTGADVLLATPTDTRDAGLFKALRGRHAVHSANLFTIAQDHGCHVLNLWGMASLRDWRMWSEDRIHLTTEGHRRVSLAALSALGHDTEARDWATPLPPGDRAGRGDELRGHVDWVRTHAAPWVERRLRGTSSGAGRTPKRPELQHFRDPEQVPSDQHLPDV